VTFTWHLRAHRRFLAAAGWTAGHPRGGERRFRILERRRARDGLNLADVEWLAEERPEPLPLNLRSSRPRSTPSSTGGRALHLAGSAPRRCGVISAARRNPARASVHKQHCLELDESRRAAALPAPMFEIVTSERSDPRRRPAAPGHARDPVARVRGLRARAAEPAPHCPGDTTWRSSCAAITRRGRREHPRRARARDRGIRVRAPRHAEALEAIIRAWAPDVVHTHLRRGTRYVARIGLAASAEARRARRDPCTCRSTAGTISIRTACSASPSAARHSAAGVPGKVFLVPTRVRMRASMRRACGSFVSSWVRARTTIGRRRRRLGTAQGLRPAHPCVRAAQLPDARW